VIFKLSGGFPIKQGKITHFYFLKPIVGIIPSILPIFIAIAGSLRLWRTPFHSNVEFHFKTPQTGQSRRLNSLDKQTPLSLKKMANTPKGRGFGLMDIKTSKASNQLVGGLFYCK
jgi:hypothetical protein